MTLVKFNENKKVNGYSTFNELLDSIFNDGYAVKPIMHKVPAVNVVETDAHFELALAAPGLNKEDFKIALEKDVLTISAETKQEDKQLLQKYTRKEFGYEAFSRSFTLPDSVDYSKIEASYNQGVLLIKINKKEEAKIQSRQIEIK